MSYETGVRWKWIPFVVLGFVLLSWIVFEALDLIDFEGVVTWVRGIHPLWAALAIFALLVVDVLLPVPSTPLIVLAGWGTVREASGVAAPFILVNSLAGLLGRGLSAAGLPAAVPLWLAAVFVGGAIGSWLGARRLPLLSIRRLLAIVLLLAGGKMLLASV